MEFPWGKVIMRGCDMQAIPPQWVGVVKMNAQGKPVLGDIEETHGKDVIAELRRGRQAPRGRPPRRRSRGVSSPPCPGSPTGRSSPCR